MSPLPTEFVEFSNWCLFVLILWVLIFHVAYIVRRSWRPEITTWGQLYRDTKWIIALSVLMLGFQMRAGIVALVRHFERNDIVMAMLKWSAPLAVSFAVLISLVGGACWIRQIMPGRISHLCYMIVIGSAIAFASWMTIFTN